MFLKLHPYRQKSLKPHQVHKLLPKYFGPFKISDKIGKVAYQLELPNIVGVHNVFHLSQLKLCTHPSSATVIPLPDVLSDTGSNLTPEAILDRKMVKRGRLATTKVLVKWQNIPAEQATCEFYYDLL